MKQTLKILFILITLPMFIGACSSTESAAPPQSSPPSPDITAHAASLASKAGAAVPQAKANAGITTLDELETLSIPALPLWVDKYASSNTGEMRFFNMSKLMERFSLQRRQAVEIQNHYRDQTRENPKGDRVAFFNEALRRAQADEYEGGLDFKRIDEAPFIIVFDLDETFYDQYYKQEVGLTCNDVSFDLKPGSKKNLKFTPGWKEAIQKINALGGAVVLYSANRDEVNFSNLSNWKLEGKSLLEHPMIDGVLTNSHLILQEKTEGSGAKNPRRGKPVREPSKDLRILDPSMKRVILIDDNPTRVFQFQNLRVFKKFDAELYCTTQDPVLKAAFDNALPTVVAEIEESVVYMKAHPGTDFVSAYLPYTSLGQVSMNFLEDAGKMETSKARDYLRMHPKVVDHKY